MKVTTLKQALNTLNLLIITTFLVLALFSALGQQIFPFVGQYRVDIEKYISEKLESEVNIRTLTGGMNIFTPYIHLEGVTMNSSSKKSSPSFSIAAIDAVLDPQASLINLAPVFKSIRISGLSIFISESEKPVDNADQDNSAVVQTFIETLLLQQNVELNNVTVEFSKKNKVQRLELDNISMVGDGFNRLMTGRVLYGNENPIKADIRIYSEGSPYKLDTFYARGTLDLPELEVDYWLDKVLDVSVFDSFKASSKFNVEFKNRLLSYAKLNISSDEVTIPGEKTIQDVNAELWLKQGSANTWTMWLADSNFSLGEAKWTFDNLALKLSKSVSGNRWQGFIKNADVQYLYDLVSSLDVMPEVIDEYYRDLMPTGDIQNFNVIVQQSTDKNIDTKFTVAGGLKGVSTKAHNSIPALTNISGVIAANKTSGRVQFKGKGMELDFPNLYDNPFKIVNGKGQVDWSLGEHGVKLVGNGLDVELTGVESLRGGFDVLIPKNESGETGTIELNLSANNVNVTAHPILVPKVIPDTLNDWLTSALQGGVIKSGQFYFYDSIGTENSNPNLELYLDAQNATLKYLEDWPKLENIKGQVFVDNNDVYGNFKSAKTLGGKMSSAQIRYLSGDEPYLWVESDASGSSAELFSYLKNTPLSSAVNNVFKDWGMRGTHNSWIGLKIPMAGDLSNMRADVKTTVRASDLLLNDINLSVDNINGQLRYSTLTGLSAPKMKAQVWGENIDSVITSTMHDRQMKSDIQFSGIMNSSRLKDWLKLSLLEPVSGKSHIDGHVIIDTREDKFNGLTFNSDLKGVSLNLPGKFSKNISEIEVLKGTLELKDGQTLRLAYGEKVNLAMKLKSGSLVAGQVFLGKTEAYLPNEPGVVIDGHLNKVNLNDWMDTWGLIGRSKYSTPPTVIDPNLDGSENADASRSVSSKQPTKPSSNPVRLLNVSVDTFEYNDFKFENVKSIIKQKNNVWVFDIDAPVANGVVTVEDKQPIKVELEYFHWPVNVAANDTETENKDPLINVDPKIFPLMDIKVSEVFLGPRNLGDWDVNVIPVKDGVKFTEIDGIIKKMKVKGDVTWIKSDDINITQTTQANLILTSDNVEGIQKGWRVKPVIEAEYGKVNGYLSWHGSPANPSISSLTGNLDLLLKGGRFIDVADAGSLSAFGLLNFSAIGRRLRLDFSDVYQSGFHFDSVKGKTRIKNGVINVIDTFEVNGPSARFASSGSVDLNTKKVNQELSATFPITGTLPFIAIIAGFTPPVAASLFVGERLIGSEIEKFTSATYKLTGTLDEPKLDLMKRFDNKIEGQQNKGFWYRMKDFFGVGED